MLPVRAAEALADGSCWERPWQLEAWFMLGRGMPPPTRLAPPILALADGLQQVRIAGYGPCAHYETRARIPLDGAMMVRAARLSP